MCSSQKFQFLLIRSCWGYQEKVLSSTAMIILLYHSMNIQQYCKYQKSGSASTLGVVTFCWGGKANSYINNLPSLWTASRYLLNVQLQCFWKKSCPATPLLTSIRKQNLIVHQWWLFGLEIFEMENNISIDRAEISFATVNLENCFVFAKFLNLLLWWLFRENLSHIWWKSSRCQWKLLLFCFSKEESNQWLWLSFLCLRWSHQTCSC